MKPDSSEHLSSERRIVSILFCDVVGSTTIAESLDPEDWVDIMNAAFRHLIAAVDHYGGSISQLRGDGLLALFGAPHAHEDDADRAVRAGLEMLDDIAELRDRVMREYGRSFEIRVGINTGMVIVGNVGYRDAIAYTALGDPVNIAARVEEMARPGSVEITDATLRLLSPGFSLERVGPVTVRGRSDAVIVHRVMNWDGDSVTSVNEYFDSEVMVGRDVEVEAIRSAVQRVLRRESGAVILIRGHAGLGKSRLIREARSIWHQNTHLNLWLLARGISYDSVRPYGLIRQLLARPSSDQSAPIHRGLTRVMKAEQDVERLLNRDDLTIQATRPDERAKRQIHESFIVWLRLLADETPVAIVLDDLHWADMTSLELVQECIPLVRDWPVLFLCATRPENAQSESALWLDPETNQQPVPLILDLQPLSGDESARLARRVRGALNFDQETIDGIIARAEGNPFFIEQMAAYPLETTTNATTGDVPDSRRMQQREARAAVPDAVQVVLTARTGLLEEADRNMLQVAAVIGQRVPFNVLSDVLDSPDDIETHIGRLISAGILREDSEYAKLQYTFQHDLIREVVYGSMLRAQLRKLHRAVARSIAILYATDIEQHAHQLAFHHEVSGDLQDVVIYSMMAGDASRRVHATAEADTHYRRAVDSASAIDHELTGQILLRGGQTALVLGQIDRAREYLVRARDIATDRSDASLLQSALYELAGLYTSEDYRSAEDLARQALEQARQIDDQTRIGLALNRLGNVMVNQLKFATGRAAHEEAYALFQETNDPWGSADSLDLIGMTYLLAGEQIPARTAFLQAADMFTELDDQERVASALTSSGLYLLVIEGACMVDVSPAECRTDVERALDICRSISWQAGETYSLTALAGTFLGDGDFDGAIDSASQALEIARSIDHAQWQLIALLALGLIDATMLDDDSSIDRFEEALDLSRRIASVQWEERILAWLGHVKRTSDLEPAFEGSVEDARDYRPANRRKLLTRSERLYQHGDFDGAWRSIELLHPDDVPGSAEVNLLAGKILLAGGEPEAAVLRLATARKLANQYGPRTLVWQITAARARYLAHRRDPAAGARELRLAEFELNGLARTVADKTRRAWFLKRARLTLHASAT